VREGVHMREGEGEIASCGLMGELRMVGGYD